MIIDDFTDIEKVSRELNELVSGKKVFVGTVFFARPTIGLQTIYNDGIMMTFDKNSTSPCMFIHDGDSLSIEFLSNNDNFVFIEIIKNKGEIEQ